MSRRRPRPTPEVRLQRALANLRRAERAVRGVRSLTDRALARLQGARWTAVTAQARVDGGHWNPRAKRLHPDYTDPGWSMAVWTWKVGETTATDRKITLTYTGATATLE